MPPAATRFDRAFEILLGHEAGFVDNPADPGGATKYGISARAYPDLDIRNLSVEAAKAIYRRDYWNRVCGDILPPGLALLLFDAAVNAGVDQAVRWLQRAAAVREDGQLGPVTLAAAREPGVALAFHRIRVQAMTRMPGWGSFGRGWAVRLAALPIQAAELAAAETTRTA